MPKRGSCKAHEEKTKKKVCWSAIGSDSQKLVGTQKLVAHLEFCCIYGVQVCRIHTKTLAQVSKLNLLNIVFQRTFCIMHIRDSCTKPIKNQHAFIF